MTGLAGAALAAPAGAHTLYNQWVVFRQKHLLVGSHRQDMPTYDIAREVVLTLEHLLPEANARTARAPHPERLASLMGTRQLELSVLSRDHVAAMLEADGDFAPYGRIPLMLIEDLGPRILVGHAEFPGHHAWLVTAALRETGYGLAALDPVPGLERHPGSVAFLEGVAVESLAEG